MKKLAVSLLMSSAVFATSAEAKVKVVASFSILGDLVANVGGDKIELSTLVGPGGDAHVFEPKPADAQAMAAADIVFVNGLGFEGFQERLVEASGFKKQLMVITEGIDSIEAEGEDDDHAGEEAGEHGRVAAAEKKDDHASEPEGQHAGEEAGEHGAIDPHAWHDTGNVRVYVKNIAEGLCTVDAASCETYKANAKAYEVKLDALDSEIETAMSQIPEDRRIVITSHDAFAYLGRAYKIRFLAPEGVSTESEASAKDVASIIRQIRSDKATALFVENISNPRLMEQIAAETGLQIGGELYSDALSPEDGPAATYIDLMRHNTGLLSKAMAGS
jgi:zinc/manganese transport system substrate-binding protein